MIRVVLVDDHPDFRWVTGRLLDRHPEVAVVGEAANGLEALEVVAQVQPDVVLMDVQMPLLDGIATTKRMRVAYPDVQIVLLSGGDDAAAVRAGLSAGAAGYLLKTTQLELLVDALRTAVDAARARVPAKKGGPASSVSAPATSTDTDCSSRGCADHRARDRSDRGRPFTPQIDHSVRRIVCSSDCSSSSCSP